LNEVIVGVGRTVKLDPLVNVIPLTVTEIVPVVAPAGTVTVSEVVLAALTTAAVPLKDTTLFAGVVLKFVPDIVTVAPTAPLVGVKEVNVGVGRRVKLEALVNVIPLTVTEMVPVVAPDGTVTVSEVVVAALTTADVPLNETILFEGVELKFVPEIITVAPTAPLDGLKDVNVGVGKTVKLEALVRVIPLTVTEMVPVVAPAGTVTVSEVVEAALTTADVPLNETTLFAGVVLKFVPEIITVAPTAPLAGVNDVKVGVGRTVKLEPLVNVIPLTVTEIVPVVAPAGTVTVNEVVVAALTTADVPLNETTLFAGVELKFVPEIITVAPTAPLDGLKDVNVGVGKTVKLEALVMVTPAVVTVMLPVVAPAGTVVVIEVAFEEVTVANVPLNLTTGLL
jgi:hypothetical protein